MVNIKGYFDFEKTNQLTGETEYTKSENMIVNEFAKLVNYKVFYNNVVSGNFDNRRLNAFMVGSSEEEETTDLKYTELYNRALKVSDGSVSLSLGTVESSDMDANMLIGFDFDVSGSSEEVNNNPAYTNGYNTGTYYSVSGAVEYSGEFTNQWAIEYTNNSHANIPWESWIGEPSKTIECFIKTTAADPGTIWGIKRNDPNYEFIWIQNGTDIRFDYDGAVSTFSTNGVTLNDGEWHYVSFVKTGSVCDFYVDGYKHDTDTGMSTDTLSISGFDAKVGAGDYWGTHSFVGAMDRFRYYSDTRTDEEIFDVWQDYVSGREAPVPEPEPFYQYESNYLYQIKETNFDTDFVQTKRLMKIEFESPSGCHVGTWREVGLVFTGTQEELPMLFNKTGGFSITKTENDIIRGKYNIVF